MDERIEEEEKIKRNNYQSKSLENISDNCLDGEIIKILKNRALTVDEISTFVKFDGNKLTDVLFSMEIKGIVRNMAGRYRL